MPGDRVEVPDTAAFVGAQVPAEQWHHQVQGNRQADCHLEFAQHQWQGQRQGQQQHDIQRQRVGQVRFEAQQQFIGQCLLRVADEVFKAHLLDHVARFDVIVGDEDDAHQQGQQKDVHHVQHPGPAQDPYASHQHALTSGDPSVGQDRRVTGEENEDFRCVAKAEVAYGQLRQGIVRHVIPEYEDQRQAAKEVDSMIASVIHNGGLLKVLMSKDRPQRLRFQASDE